MTLVSLHSVLLFNSNMFKHTDMNSARKRGRRSLTAIVPEMMHHVLEQLEVSTGRIQTVTVCEVTLHKQHIVLFGFIPDSQRKSNKLTAGNRRLAFVCKRRPLPHRKEELLVLSAQSRCCQSYCTCVNLCVSAGPGVQQTSPHHVSAGCAVLWLDQVRWLLQWQCSDFIHPTHTDQYFL